MFAPGCVQIDRRLAAGLVLVGVRRHPLLVRAPAELGRLQALRHEALDRPGVDERLHRLRLLGALGVALGDVDALDAELPRKLAPLFAGHRLLELEPGVLRDVEQCLLDEPGHHAGIGAAARHRRGAAGLAGALGLHGGFAERVVGARRGSELGVEVEASPRLVDRIDVERADLVAQFHDVERRGVDRQVDAEALAAARGEQRRQEMAVVLAGHRLMDEADAPLVQELAVLVLRVDHHEAGLVVVEMPLDQRQRAFADRAEADHHNGTVDAAVDGVGGHDLQLQTTGWSYPSNLTDGICAARRSARRPRDFRGSTPPWARASR